MLDLVVGEADGGPREKRESLKGVSEVKLVARETLVERVKEGGKDSASLKSLELEPGFVGRATAASACLTKAALSVTTGGTVPRRRRSLRG